ncbi:RagB/SusD family nutrient uptake outer membrane protein [Paraflavitalea sp. CAU 1676]|uniref:RagB/SusD family nutrient uptake outer membrane protein n=1 Tax=Paraflavitalea sp. CAU 1676 TaxID=3032598 RepID=UPI0023DC06D7|nr:RagB/SusD family nutrient uptake outer membrane protein [Paraflavitalea sp. CAU 1676]MDF2190439.1 RagB/SusD family nutrient uptake outer membrane protein [Paraflavitalea sp. CAU 1676]
MKTILVNKIALTAGVASLLSLAACNKVLDKYDQKSIPGELIYNDSTLVKLNIDYIYENNLPGWGGNSNLTGGSISGSATSLSDESYGESKFFEGTVTTSDVGDIGTGLNANNNYGRIRVINMLLRDVDAGILPADTKKRLKAHAFFFRAYRYFDLVRLYGGVPLVTTALDAVGEQAKAEALRPRNTTAECIDQIVKDLDSAIAWLPAKYTASADWGRITSGAAAAFKGRVLMTYASPQFNPGDDVARWQRAYDANLQAKTLLDGGGFGLHASYDAMWFSEVNNPEAVMITGYNTATGDQVKKNNGYDNSTRPSYLGTGGGSNQPSWEMVKAYPMKDGKLPGDATSAYAYSDQLFYKNRDPRFDKTIGYNGVNWPINGNANYKLWTYYAANKTVENKATNTGFYTRKAINPTVDISNVQYSGTDWMEIRYAEVLLNLAECAAGIGRVAADQEAYTGLVAVRKRAGLQAGGGSLYGLKSGMSRAELFDAILFERRIEFAFEGKRFWDLRRWKKIESVLNGTRRQKVTINLKTGAGIPSAADFANPASPNYRDKVDLDVAYTNYFELVFGNLDTKYAINWKPEYYFFGIPPATMTNNPNIVQSNTWGGGFDPLK